MKTNPLNQTSLILILIFVLLLSACTVDSNQLAGAALSQPPVDSGQSDPTSGQTTLFLPLIQQGTASAPNAELTVDAPVAEEQADVQAAIVGGTSATPGEYPWQAMLLSNGSFFCGGSLIHPQWVLTAAHCLSGQSIKQFQVILGAHKRTDNNESGRQTIGVKRLIIHSGYNSSTLNNDIGLIELATPAALTARVTVIPLAILPTDNSLYAAGRQATATGWGTTSSGGWIATILQEVTMPLVSTDSCRQSYGNSRITNNMLCAGLQEGGKDTCQGDSGGPLIVQDGPTWKLVGLTSWGNGCAEPNYPGVYTQVANYTSWIGQYLNYSQRNGAWTKVYGGLTNVSVGVDGTVWGVSRDHIIWQWNGTVWNAMGGVLTQIAVGSATQVWGVSPGNEVVQWTGTEWRQYPGLLKQIDVGCDGTVWGVSPINQVFRWDGSNWAYVSDNMNQVAVGNANTVWGLGLNNDIYRWDGSKWNQVSGALQQIDVGCDGAVLGVSPIHELFYWTSNGWSRMEGVLNQISAGSGAQIWGVNTADEIFRRD